jgi:hypothetical protein
MLRHSSVIKQKEDVDFSRIVNECVSYCLLYIIAIITAAPVQTNSSLAQQALTSIDDAVDTLSTGPKDVRTVEAALTPSMRARLGEQHTPVWQAHTNKHTLLFTARLRVSATRPTFIDYRSMYKSDQEKTDGRPVVPVKTG